MGREGISRQVANMKAELKAELDLSHLMLY